MSIYEKFRKSAQQVTNIRALTLAGMFLAINVVFGYLGNYSLLILPTIKLSLSFLPRALSGALLGPVLAGIAGGLGDILSFFLNPPAGGYFPGWTINAALGGLIYGIFLYENPTNLKNLILAKSIIMIVVDLLLGTYWLYIQFGMPFFVTLWGRVAKEVITFPAEIAIIYSVTKAMQHLQTAKDGTIK